jgi:SAM-dependent methyltransferase
VTHQVRDLRGTGVWPKQLPESSDEEQRVRDAFIRRWHEILPRRGRIVERFNHDYPLRGPVPKGRTLDIGAGLGEHVRFEDLTRQEYYALELRPEMAAVIEERYPQIQTIVADCQRHLPFRDGFFDRILAIHVLEHLPDLPRALDEISRVLAPRGRFVVVIPCEGGLVYWLARRTTAQRVFEREFGRAYTRVIRGEHLNVPWEVTTELRKRFRVVHSQYFPLRIPSVALNLVIGITLEPLGAGRPT